MAEPSSPLGPRSPDLAIDPIIVWRMWRLERGLDGALTLVSPVQALRWQPMEPARAICHGHRSPEERCSCGLYAASTPERLRTAGVASWSPACCVIGTVAMWGKVIEHVLGARGELAYPDRIRFVCAGCFTERRRPDPTLVWTGSNRELITSCGRHHPQAELLRLAPADLQAELLSAYAVDLLPLEALGETAAFPRAPMPVHALATQARREVRQLGGSWVGWLMAVAVVALIFSAVRGGDPEVPAPRAAAISAGGAWSPSPRAAPSRAHHVRKARSRSRYALECGSVEATVVTIGGCGRPGADLLGFVSSPPDPRRECLDDGYTRRPRFSACWFDPSRGADPPPHPARWWLPGVHHADIFRR